MTAAVALGVALARWLASALVDGTLLAAAAWLLSVTCLRRASGRVLALLWFCVVLGFVLPRPVQVHAAPRWGVTSAEGFGTAAGAGLAGAGYAGFGAAYLAVSVCLLARLALGQRRLRRRIGMFDGADAEVLAALRVAAGKLGLARLPEVRVADAPFGPFTLGPARPVLVLPRWLCRPGPRLDAVLLHELAHLERRDHWLVWLERGVACLFFFWPPVHWVCAKLDEAREVACDERAIQRGAFRGAEYGQHLVEVVALARERSVTAGTLGIGRGAWRLERRIDRLLREAGSRRWVWLEGLAVLLLGACSLLGLRQASELRPVKFEQPPAQLTGVAVPAAASGSDEGPLMSIDESQQQSAPAGGSGQGCVLQGCGTQCAP